LPSLNARVEYALNGGRINTDAVDNSAGVDLSDHEVNLKILLRSPLVGRPDVLGDKDRNQLLNALADDVCASVLNDNYRQSVPVRTASVASNVGPFMDLADQLENAGLLDKAVHAFPSRKDVLARAGKRLTRPELAVLMAYSNWR
jgi:glutamate dehydrogenase